MLITTIATSMVISNNTQTIMRSRGIVGTVLGKPCPIKLEVGQMKRGKLVEKTKLAILQNRLADCADKARKAKQNGASPRELLKLTFRG